MAMCVAGSQNLMGHARPVQSPMLLPLLLFSLHVVYTMVLPTPIVGVSTSQSTLAVGA